MFKAADLFDLAQTEHAAIFDGCKFAWDALKKIEGYIAANLKPELRNKCEGRAYIGDSILGHKAHLGAGVKISNVKLFPGNVEVEVDGVPFDTGLRKFGALLGDGAEVGCNAVLNPGSIVGRGAVIYPNVFWRGILPANMIAKNKAEIEVVVKRPRE